MKPKKHLIARAEANGSIARLNQLLSVSHILLCEANGLLEEAADLMASNGLLLGELKQLHKQLPTAISTNSPPWSIRRSRRWTCSPTWTSSMNSYVSGASCPRIGSRKKASEFKSNLSAIKSYFKR